MLKIDHLSYWERKSYFENIDFLIIGAGIVGLSTAYYLRKRFLKAKIVVIERGFLPTGASTKNAGFTCFGSPSELKDDLLTIDESKVWDTVNLRYEGLQRLFSIIDKDRIGYKKSGSWDLIQKDDEKLNLDFIQYLNEKIFQITRTKNVYSEDNEVIFRCGFKGFETAYKNILEGCLHTDLLIHELFKKVISLDIHVLFGINAYVIENSNANSIIQTGLGEIKASKVFICTNGFAKHFLENEDIHAARAQVLVTKPIANLKINGTFHVNKGYTYFRNVEDRILLGGGRNLDFLKENTEEFSNTEIIKAYLSNFLRKNILSNESVEIDYYWSGIMGVGKEKKPIIKKVNNNVFCGVRMGGMGVAIGSDVGYTLSNLV